MMLGMLQAIHHYIRTSYSDSASNYSSIRIPLQGVLQYNGAGPAIWLVVSIPIINMIKAKGFGLRCYTHITKEEFHFSCYTFVDDTDLIHCPKGTQDFRTIVTEMQLMLYHLQGGFVLPVGLWSRLKATGI
jgi:hypothetical protein